MARSSGITSEDCKLLEGLAFGFGQTADKRYLKSLASDPAFFTRVLRNGRRGLTRVFDGGPDDNGRPTLRMITAVVLQREWDTEIVGDLNILLHDSQIWRWQPGSEIVALKKAGTAPDVTIPRKSARKIAELITQIERCVKGGASLMVSCDEFDGEQIRGVEMLITPSLRALFTSAYRSLSPQLAVMLNCLAPEAPTQKIGYRHDPNAPLSDYARFLIDRGLDTGTLPIVDLLSYRPARPSGPSVTSPSGAQIPPPPPPMPKSRLPVLAIGTLITAVIVAFALGYLVGTKRSRPEIVAVTQSTTLLTNDTTRSHPIPALPRPTVNPAMPSTAPAQDILAGAESDQAKNQRNQSSTGQQQDSSAAPSTRSESKPQPAIATPSAISASAPSANHPTSQSAATEIAVMEEPLAANPSTTSATQPTPTKSVVSRDKDDLTPAAASRPSTRQFDRQKEFASIKSDYQKLLQPVDGQKVFDSSAMATSQKALFYMSEASMLKNLPKEEQKWLDDNGPGLVAIENVIKRMRDVEQALHQYWTVSIEGNEAQVKQRKAELKAAQAQLRQAVDGVAKALKISSLVFPLAKDLDEAAELALKNK